MLTFIGAKCKGKFKIESKDVKFRKDLFRVVENKVNSGYGLAVSKCLILVLKDGDVRTLYEFYVKSYRYDKKLIDTDDYRQFLYDIFLKFVDNCKLRKIQVIKCSELYDAVCDFCKNKPLRIFLNVSDDVSLVSETE